ncbi:hypothetical protein BRD04_06675 [Halobacteriales archaeon QS_9_67_17]|nr:MAG: hypothetical protein BRD04_06675 [Halobacteriales archaeon QS_9_67_17]
MSTTTSTTRPRAGNRTETRTDDARWTDERRLTTTTAPRTFDYRRPERLPNATDDTNASVPR